MKTLYELIKQYPQILIDSEDLAKFGFWSAHISVGYVVLNYLGVKKRLHAHITNPPEGYIADHKNRITLDNRRVNLRICTQAQNMSNVAPKVNNKLGYKGVVYLEKSGKYRARLATTVNGVIINKHLGCFDTLEQAANAYDQAKLARVGEFAYLNNISHKTTLN
jgi:hypothetical protein